MHKFEHKKKRNVNSIAKTFESEENAFDVDNMRVG